MARLEDVCEILDNKRVPITASDREPGPYPYYGANGVQDYVNGYIFDDELVLLAEDGGNFGSKEKPIAYRVSGKCWVNNHAHVLKPKAGLDIDYLCYSLMFYDVSGLVNGATRQKLTQADMRKMEIPLPSIEKQRNIAAVLNKVCNLIALRKQQLNKLDELVKARFVEMFWGFEHDSNLVPLSSICEMVTVGIANSATHAYSNDGVIMFRNQNIKENHLDDSDLIYIQTKFADKYKTKALEENDLLVTRTGYPGIACIVPKKYEGCQTFTTLIVRLKEKDKASANYVCHYINSSYGKRYVDETKVGVAQQNFGAKVLEKMPIFLPPRKQLTEYSHFLDQIGKYMLTIQQGLDKIEVMKKALMQKYFE